MTEGGAARRHRGGAPGPDRRGAGPDGRGAGPEPESFAAVTPWLECTAEFSAAEFNLCFILEGSVHSRRVGAL